MLTYTRFDITNLELPFEREYTFEEGTFIFMVYENRVSYAITKHTQHLSLIHI